MATKTPGTIVDKVKDWQDTDGNVILQTGRIKDKSAGSTEVFDFYQFINSTNGEVGVGDYLFLIAEELDKDGLVFGGKKVAVDLEPEN